MKILESIESIPQIKKGYITIGFYDAFHLGHRRVLKVLGKLARDGKKIAITFKDHPLRVIAPQKAPGVIFPPSYRIKEFAHFKIDYLVMLEFGIEIANMEARDFLLLVKQHISELTLVVGEDFAMGRNRLDDKDKILAMSEEVGFECVFVENYIYRGEKLGSRLIRNMIMAGNLEEAIKITRMPFFIEGMVIHGKKIGRQIGFPTININYPSNTVEIANGVYAGWVYIKESVYGAMIDVHSRYGQKMVEAHILEFDDDVYGMNARVFFFRRIRDNITFEDSDMDKMKSFIERDKEIITYTLKGNNHILWLINKFCRFRI